MTDETVDWTGVQSERFDNLSGHLNRVARGQQAREARINRGQGIVGQYTLELWKELVVQAAQEDDPELFLMACLITTKRKARTLRIRDADVQNLRQSLISTPQA